MQANLSFLALAILLGVCSVGCRPSPSNDVINRSIASNLHDDFQGVWSDSFDDFAFTIYVNGSEIQIFDPPFSRWESIFSDTKVVDGTLMFTQSSVLKSGEYHPVNDTCWDATIRLNADDSSIATLASVSLEMPTLL